MSESKTEKPKGASAAHRRKHKNAAPPSFPVSSLAELQIIRLFRDLPALQLQSLEGKVRRASAYAGEDIIEFEPNNAVFHHFFFISQGQIKIEGFDENAKKRPLNFLRKGEFFVDKSIAWRGMISTRAVAITDCEIFIIHKDALKNLAQIYAPFERALKNVSDRIDYRNRLYCEDNYSRSVLDFLVDTALTQASRVKITQMDLCIECDTCYESCEDRHGFQRIKRGYARFGVLDIAQSCLTCFYPTCIPACPVDSVVFNNQTREVEILDDCIGCMACEKACQYGAITIHKVDTEDPRFNRFLNSGAKKSPKFIADKCNHCFGYEDLACITNCPTGAILEISASDFLENPTIFGVSENVRNPLPSLTEASSGVKFFQKFYLILATVVTAFLTYELWATENPKFFSYLLLLQNNGWLSPEWNLSFHKGSDFTLFLGNLGFSFIVVAMIYPLRKAFPKPFRYLGQKALWLDLHNFTGFMGTILVLFHTGFDFSWSLGGLGMIALCFVMLTGLFGRFLYQAIPRGVAGTELKVKDIEEEDRQISRRLDAIFEDSTEYRHILDQILKASEISQTEKTGLWQLVRSTLVSQSLIWKLKLRVPPQLRPFRKHLRTFFQLAREKVRLRRNTAFLEFTSRLFIKWQYVHKPVAYIMGMLAIAHVIQNLIFFSWDK